MVVRRSLLRRVFDRFYYEILCKVIPFLNVDWRYTLGPRGYRIAAVAFGTGVACVGGLVSWSLLQGTIRLLTVGEPVTLDSLHEDILRLQKPGRTMFGTAKVSADTADVLLEGKSASLDLLIQFESDADSLDHMWGFSSGELVIEDADGITGSALTVPARAWSSSGDGSEGTHWGDKIGGGPGRWTSGRFTPECLVTLPASLLDLPVTAGHMHRSFSARATMSAVYPMSSGPGLFANRSCSYTHQFKITVVPEDDMRLWEHSYSWNHRKAWPVLLLLAIVALGVAINGGRIIVRGLRPAKVARRPAGL